MSKLQYIAITPTPKLRVIRQKIRHIDPVRYPDVQEPLEKEFLDSYQKVIKNIKTMVGFELLKQMNK
jgi:hypothetical protein